MRRISASRIRIDLKFLVIPASSNKCNLINHGRKVVLCEWNSDNIDEYYHEGKKTNSKLIELKFENSDSFNDKQRFDIPTSKSNYSPCSLISKTFTSELKYFSNSAATRLHSLSNAYIRECIHKSTSSYASSTISDVSVKNNTNKIKIGYPEDTIPNINSDRSSTLKAKKTE